MIGRACSVYEIYKKCLQTSAGEFETKRPLESHNIASETNIKTDLKDTHYNDVDCIGRSEDVDHRKLLMNTVMNIEVA
jgi:hypothetical protein